MTSWDMEGEYGQPTDQGSDVRIAIRRAAPLVRLGFWIPQDEADRQGLNLTFAAEVLDHRQSSLKLSIESPDCCLKL